MRYNQKMKHKQVRFDRIFLFQSPSSSVSHISLEPQSIQLVGTKPIDSETKEEVWPSDHFGLFATFRVLETL
jgi:hypothetical protein